MTTLRVKPKPSSETTTAVEQAVFTAVAATPPPAMSVATHAVKSSYNAYWEKTWAERKAKENKENKNVQEENPFADLSDRSDSECPCRIL